jgi:hypothetical protein
MSDDVARIEVQHQDANHALFLVLVECCLMITEAGDEVKGTAATFAQNVQSSGKSKMANKEVADCAYHIAHHLKSWPDPRAEMIKRVLAHLMLADRWEAKLR